MKKKLILIITIVLVLCGCADKKVSVSSTEKPKKLSVKQILVEGDYILLDVRTKEEYDEMHLVDSINIPYDEIDSSIDLDKTKNILVYCKSGQRASIAVSTLTSLGYSAYNIGGIEDIGLPKE